MAAIKPAEVSAILKNQLAGIDASSSLNEVGTVLEVGDGIARVSMAFPMHNTESWFVSTQALKVWCLT